MTDTHFRILMHPEIADRLDDTLSPLDGIVAIDTVYQRLGEAHAARKIGRWWRRSSRPTNLYHATFDALPSEIVYIEFGDTLHVIGAAPTYVGDQRRFDCVLSTDGIDLDGDNQNDTSA